MIDPSTRRAYCFCLLLLLSTSRAVLPGLQSVEGRSSEMVLFDILDSLLAQPLHYFHGILPGAIVKAPTAAFYNYTLSHLCDLDDIVQA